MLIETTCTKCGTSTCIELSDDAPPAIVRMARRGVTCNLCVEATHTDATCGARSEAPQSPAHEYRAPYRDD